MHVEIYLYQVNMETVSFNFYFSLTFQVVRYINLIYKNLKTLMDLSFSKAINISKNNLMYLKYLFRPNLQMEFKFSFHNRMLLFDLFSRWYRLWNESSVTQLKLVFIIDLQQTKYQQI